MSESKFKRIMDEWENLVNNNNIDDIPIITYLDETIKRINKMYDLRFYVSYQKLKSTDLNRLPEHILTIEHLNPSFVVLLEKHTGIITKEQMKEAASIEFLKYLMFAKTDYYIDRWGVNIKYISLQDLIKNK